MKTKITLLVSLLLLCSCTTTDDPRKGGLIGYLGTGESGYQRRVDQKGDERDIAEGRAQHEERTGSALANHREGVRQRLEEQRREIASLNAETERLLADLSQLENLDADKTRERDALAAQLRRVDKDLGDLNGSTSLMIDERQARLQELQTEVAQLLEQFSLLTTL